MISKHFEYKGSKASSRALMNMASEETLRATKANNYFLRTQNSQNSNEFKDVADDDHSAAPTGQFKTSLDFFHNNRYI